MSGATFIHSTACVDDPVQIGAGTKIWHFCHVMSDVVIGTDCVFGQNVFIASGVRIGNNVRVQNNVSLYEGVQLEDDVFCGPSMVFTNVINPRSHVSRKEEYLPTLVRRGATIGANATIVCGNTIGRFAFVAAGAVVTNDLPDHALAVGVPATVRGWMCICGEKIDFRREREGDRADCLVCGKSYGRSDLEVYQLET